MPDRGDHVVVHDPTVGPGAADAARFDAQLSREPPHGGTSRRDRRVGRSLLRRFGRINLQRLGGRGNGGMRLAVAAGPVRRRWRSGGGRGLGFHRLSLWGWFCGGRFGGGFRRLRLGWLFRRGGTTLQRRFRCAGLCGDDPLRRLFQRQQHLSDFDRLARLDVNLRHLTADRARNGNDGFVGLDLDHILLRTDRIPFVDQQADDVAGGDVLAEIRQFEFSGHKGNQ